MAWSRLNEKQTCCGKLANDRNVTHEESTSNISFLSNKVAEMVTKVLSEELLCLDDVIKKFNQEFNDKPDKLAEYKMALRQHVERQFYNKVNALRIDVSKQVKECSADILKRYLALVQDENVAKDMRQSVCKDYAPEFKIDLNKISSDFQENLSFRCSKNKPKYEHSALDWSHEATRDLSWKSIFTPSFTIWTAKMAVYLGNYAYEYWNWTKKAKEEALKTQFVSHMTDNFQSVIEQTSEHNAEQIKFALKETLIELDNVVYRHVNKMRADIAQLESDIQQYRDIVAKSRKLKNTAPILKKVLKGFHHKYILV